MDATPDSQRMIEAERLTKRYGALTAVDDVTFDVPAGCIAGFLGPNGAGKTTTIRMIVGAVPPTAGRVRIGGLDVAREWRAARHLIGYLPESAPHYPEMRVEEFLAFRARLQGVATGSRREAIDEALARCQLTGVRRRLVGQLSKGYRQRTGLAAALLHRPKLLILDEPTVGLDPTQVMEFRSLLRDLSGSCTVLVSSHILPEVEAVCDRLIMIRDGRLVASGDLPSLRSMAAGRRRYVMEAKLADATDLPAVPGVHSAVLHSRDGAWHRIEVTAAEDADDLREALAGWAADRKVAVRELRGEEETLESLFVRLAARSPSSDAAAEDS